MGIGGSGMAGVAKLASKMGYSVSGCDLESSSAYSKHIQKGHSDKHLKGVDLLVVSPAVLYQNKDNPEYKKAEDKGIAMTWQEFLGEHLLKDKKVIAIAGTHGKSTTTAMAGQMLEVAKFDPIVVLGAKVPKWGGGVRFGNGEWAVVEADEFNDNFLYYHPEIIVLNNIEFDHPDYFKNEKQVKKSFEKFIKNLTGRKLLLTQRDNLNKKFNLKVMGEHNQKNANMVYVLGKKLCINEKIITKSLERFNGIGRRMELLGKSKSGFSVYDDYAHHPTAIKTTLRGLKSKYPRKNIWVVDEAHGYERTYRLLKDYKGVFDGADGAIIGPIFKARDKDTHGLTSSSIAKVSKHKNIFSSDSFENVLTLVKEKVKKGDILVVMGAGKSYLWAKKFLDL